MLAAPCCAHGSSPSSGLAVDAPNSLPAQRRWCPISEATHPTAPEAVWVCLVVLFAGLIFIFTVTAFTWRSQLFSWLNLFIILCIAKGKQKCCCLQMSTCVVNVLLGEEALHSYFEGKLKLLSTISLLYWVLPRF